MASAVVRVVFLQFPFCIDPEELFLSFLIRVRSVIRWGFGEVLNMVAIIFFHPAHGTRCLKGTVPAPRFLERVTVLHLPPRHFRGFLFFPNALVPFHPLKGWAPGLVLYLFFTNALFLGDYTVVLYLGRSQKDLPVCQTHLSL